MDVRSQLQRIKNDRNMMSNPAVQNVFNLLENKNSKGLMELFSNTCNTKGINPQDFLNNLKR